MTPPTAVLFPKTVLTVINGRKVKLYKHITYCGEIFENNNGNNHSWWGITASFAAIMAGYAFPFWCYNIYYNYTHNLEWNQKFNYAWLELSEARQWRSALGFDGTYCWLIATRFKSKDSASCDTFFNLKRPSIIVPPVPEWGDRIVTLNPISKNLPGWARSIDDLEGPPEEEE